MIVMPPGTQPPLRLPEPPPPPPARTLTGRRLVTLVVSVSLVVVALVGAGGVGALHAYRTHRAAVAAAAARAAVKAEHKAVRKACRASVTVQLKYPGSARYGHLRLTADDGGHEYTAFGYVDAQNGFGALKRLTFTCTVDQRFDTTKERWTRRWSSEAFVTGDD